MPRLRPIISPDGRQIYCVHRDEVRGLTAQIAVYLRHGIQINAGDIVFDVGANIGLFALEAARRGALVHAFEPLPATFSALMANARGHQIQPHNLALGARAEQTNFAYFRYLSALSTRFPELVGANAASGVMAALDDPTLAPRFGWFRRAPKWIRRALVALLVKLLFQPKLISCRVETLSRVVSALQISRIALLKIDVEGAEADVLSGIAEHDWPRIHQIVAEVHDENGRLKRVETLLRERGFAVHSEPEPQTSAWGVWLLWARR